MERGTRKLAPLSSSVGQKGENTNMKVLGVHIATGQFRYSVLEGTKISPVLVVKDRLVTPATTDVPALMDWYES